MWNAAEPSILKTRVNWSYLVSQNDWDGHDPIDEYKEEGRPPPVRTFPKPKAIANFNVDKTHGELKAAIAQGLYYWATQYASLWFDYLVSDGPHQWPVDKNGKGFKPITLEETAMKNLPKSTTLYRMILYINLQWERLQKDNNEKGR